MSLLANLVLFFASCSNKSSESSKKATEKLSVSESENKSADSEAEMTILGDKPVGNEIFGKIISFKDSSVILIEVEKSSDSSYKNGDRLYVDLLETDLYRYVPSGKDDYQRFMDVIECNYKLRGGESIYIDFPKGKQRKLDGIEYIKSPYRMLTLVEDTDKDVLKKIPEIKESDIYRYGKIISFKNDNTAVVKLEAPLPLDENDNMTVEVHFDKAQVFEYSLKSCKGTVSEYTPKIGDRISMRIKQGYHYTDKNTIANDKYEQRDGYIYLEPLGGIVKYVEK